MTVVIISRICLAKYLVYDSSEYKRIYLAKCLFYDSSEYEPYMSG
jgi:hypothetical protein